MKISRDVEVDLRALEYSEWPEEAKQLARAIVTQEHREFKQQLDKKDWLVARVESYAAGLDGFEDV